MDIRTPLRIAKRPDACFSNPWTLILAEKIDPRYNLDAVEPKLFGIGSESYVVGSMEFYAAYALSRKILLTLDSGTSIRQKPLQTRFLRC